MHAVAGKREGLPQRYAPVLVGIGRRVVEGVDEVLGKYRLEPLRGRVGRRQNHSSAAGELLKEGKARTGGIDKNHPARQRFDELGPVGRGRSEEHTSELQSP